MNFNSVFFGYDKEQVDKYIRELKEKYDENLAEQKERIFSLVEENAQLADQLKQYKIDEQAITKSLVESQKLADELRNDAEKFSQLTLNRAKIFYAAWQAYAKTLLSTLSDDEMKQFTSLHKRMEQIINAFEGGDVAADTTLVKANEQVEEALPSDATMHCIGKAETKEPQQPNYQNPVKKVEEASGQAIDLKQILKPEESLEDLCKELGLI